MTPQHGMDPVDISLMAPSRYVIVNIIPLPFSKQNFNILRASVTRKNTPVILEQELSVSGLNFLYHTIVISTRYCAAFSAFRTVPISFSAQANTSHSLQNFKILFQIFIIKLQLLC